MATRVFVISLRDSPRREMFRRRASTELPWHFFDACTSLSEDLQYNPDDALKIGGRELSPTEQAVYSSHYSLWQQLLTDHASRYVIFEDDAIVDWRILEAISADDRSIDFLRLGVTLLSPIRVVDRRFIHNHQLVETLGHCYGAFAYVISRRAADTFVQHFRRAVRPVDTEIDRAWAHRIPTLALYPFPVIHESGVSVMDQERWISTKKPFVVRARRAIIRAQDFVQDRLWRLRRRLRTNAR
jgi:glycosyl transferase family 25